MFPLDKRKVGVGVYHNRWQCDCVVLHHFRLYFQRMRDLKRWVMQDETHRDSNCVLITFIGHGDDKGWLKDKDKRIAWHLEDFLGDLSVVDTLLGKPKIVVVQACRGSECFCLGAGCRSPLNSALFGAVLC